MGEEVNKAQVFRPVVAKFAKGIFPLKLIVGVTSNCNSNCLICNIWKKKDKQILPLEYLQKIIAYLDDSLLWIELTGGEISLVPEFGNYVLAAMNSTGIFSVVITTNGFLTDRIIEEVRLILKKIPKDRKFFAVVSLDGIDEVHDKIRGIPGAFDKAFKTLADLLKMEKESANFEVGISYTISTYNVGRLAEFFEFLEAKNISLSKVGITLEHNSSYYDRNDADISLPVEDLIRDIIAYNKAREDIKLNGLINKLKASFYKKYSRKILDFIKTGKTQLPCRSGRNSLYISPKGEIYVCTQWDYKIGSISSSGIKIDYNRWKNAMAIIKNNKCPGCWTVCEAMTSWIVALPRSFFI